MALEQQAMDEPFVYLKYQNEMNIRQILWLMIVPALMWACEKDEQMDVSHPEDIDTDINQNESNVISQCGTPVMMAWEYEEPYLESGIGHIGVPGERFVITVPLPCEWPDDMQIRIDGQKIVYEYARPSGNTEPVSCVGEIPTDIAPGDHTVSLWHNGMEKVLLQRLRIMPWQPRSMDVAVSAPMAFNVNASLQLGHRYYVISNVGMVEFDLRTLKLVARHTSRVNHAVECGGVGYGVTNTQLVRWDLTANKWVTVTNLPQTDAVYAPMCKFFATEGKLYYGGGKDKHESPLYACWQYDLATHEWTQVSDLPAQIEGTCHQGSTAYAYDTECNLWTYNADRDEWNRMARYRYGYEYQSGSVLAMMGNRVVKLTVPNGYASEACLYAPQTNEWQQMAVFTAGAYRGAMMYETPMAAYEGRVVAGPFGTSSDEDPHLIILEPHKK